MDLAFVDKLARDSTGVKYLIVHQDLRCEKIEKKGMQRNCSSVFA